MAITDRLRDLIPTCTVSDLKDGIFECLGNVHAEGLQFSLLTAAEVVFLLALIAYLLLTLAYPV
jgi:hypothetical protein